MGSRFTRSVPVTINDVLDGHVALDLQCLDRLYLHGYLAQLQVGGQVIQFLKHQGYPVPSPACLQQIGDTFRRRVASFADPDPGANTRDRYQNGASADPGSQHINVPDRCLAGSGTGVCHVH